jgi:multidrug resistance efflux pump
VLATRKAFGLLVSLVALVGVIATVVLAARRIDQRPRTDDAYLQADLVHMAPDVATARAAVTRAHAQSLINAAALAFATGELTSSTSFAAAGSR